MINSNEVTERYMRLTQLFILRAKKVQEFDEARADGDLARMGEIKLELEKINESIAKNKNIILDKVKKFNSLKAGVPKLEINALKESAINSLEAGYDLGVKIRGKGEINEDFIDNKPIEDLVKLDQKLKIFYKVFSETKE